MGSVQDEVGIGGPGASKAGTGVGTARGRVRVEAGSKRVRAYLAGRLVVDSIHPVLVWEVPYYPAYYLPRADVDEPVYTHPRDPYTRVDVLASSRHVRVEVAGAVVADSRAPRILFETGLPPRYYLPLQDVRMDLLRPSDTRTGCPYKGTASYFHLELDGRRYEDYVWIYRYPLPESQKIAGLVAFYNERVDLWVDGVRQPRPHTKFS